MCTFDFSFLTKLREFPVNCKTVFHRICRKSRCWFSRGSLFAQVSSFLTVTWTILLVWSRVFVGFKFASNSSRFHISLHKLNYDAKRLAVDADCVLFLRFPLSPSRFVVFFAVGGDMWHLGVGPLASSWIKDCDIPLQFGILWQCALAPGFFRGISKLRPWKVMTNVHRWYVIGCGVFVEFSVCSVHPVASC